MSHIVQIEWDEGSRIHNKVTTYGGRALHFAEIITGRSREEVNRLYGDRLDRDEGASVVIAGKNRGYPDVVVRRTG